MVIVNQCMIKFFYCMYTCWGMKGIVSGKKAQDSFVTQKICNMLKNCVLNYRSLKHHSTISGFCPVDVHLASDC